MRQGEEVEVLRQAVAYRQVHMLKTTHKSDSQIMSSGMSNSADSHYQVGQLPGARSGGLLEQPLRAEEPPAGGQPVGGPPQTRRLPAEVQLPEGPLVMGQPPVGPLAGGQPPGDPPPARQHQPAGGQHQARHPMEEAGNRQAHRKWPKCNIL